MINKNNNMYALTEIVANQFFETHHSQLNALIAGDFNTHNTMWYDSEFMNQAEMMANNRRKALKLITNIKHHDLVLDNIPGTFTHFLRTSKYDDIIPDVTFTSRHTTTITGNWFPDLELS